jgi:hypothetical protein
MLREADAVYYENRMDRIIVKEDNCKNCKISLCREDI